MSTNPKYKKTERIKVQVLLSSGSSLNVTMFVGQMDRVNDLLNDGRNFIPFEDVSGQLRLLNKAMIVTVIPLDQEDANRLEPAPSLGAPDDDAGPAPQEGPQGA